MLELFHAPQSRSTRILWLLEELGARFEGSSAKDVIVRGDGKPSDEHELFERIARVPVVPAR